MAVLGMSVVVLGYGCYLAMLFALRRFTYRTWLFHAVILIGIVLALIGLATGDAGLPAWIAIGLGVAWFPLTRRELTLVGSERLTLRVGDRLPPFAAQRPDGTPITDQDVVARAPSLLVLYRGWWCPSTRALLDELLRDHERLTAAGLTTFAASVDPPERAAGIQEHVGDGITIVCSFPVARHAAISRCPPRSWSTPRDGSSTPSGHGESTIVPVLATSSPASSRNRPWRAEQEIQVTTW